jgi:hypothetical protein
MSRSHVAGLAASILLVLYLLSPGPVIKYYETTQRMPPPSLVAIYMPLGWLCDHVRFVEDAYQRYFKMWGIGRS